MKKGKIVQVMGPVVDVEFEDDDLPYIKDALEVDNNGQKCIMEVSQHIGNHTVRCVMLSASEGLYRDMEVIAPGGGIKVPVGEQTLGRLFNVTGETIDGGEELKDVEKWSIHRDPPAFEDQNPVAEVLETGIKVIALPPEGKTPHRRGEEGPRRQDSHHRLRLCRVRLRAAGARLHTTQAPRHRRLGSRRRDSPTGKPPGRCGTRTTRTRIQDLGGCCKIRRIVGMHPGASALLYDYRRLHRGADLQSDRNFEF